MTTISLRLPDSLHEAVRNLAKREHTSINQLAALENGPSSATGR